MSDLNKAPNDFFNNWKKLIPCHIEMLLNYMLKEVVKKRY